MFDHHRKLRMGQMPLVLPKHNLRYWLGLLVGGRTMLREEELRRLRGETPAEAWVVGRRKRLASWLLSSVKLVAKPRR